MNATFDVSGVVLQTTRVILREWKLSDLDDFYEYASVFGVGENAGWPSHKSKEESLKILKLFIKEKKTLAIVSKSNNKVIGSIGIELYKFEDKLTELHDLKGREIGYVLSKDYWGKGIMPEVIERLVDYLFNQLDYDFILCGYYDFNIQSKRVQEKCGFKPYRKVVYNTRLETKEKGTLMVLTNSNKNIRLNFSPKETLKM